MQLFFAAQNDKKKLFRFFLVAFSMLVLYLLAPAAALAGDNGLQETRTWAAGHGTTTYVTFERNGTAEESKRNQGKAHLEVYVMQPGAAAYPASKSTDYETYTSDFYYQYNGQVDGGLTFDPESRTFSPLAENNNGGKGVGGYGSLDLKITVKEPGYTIYHVDYVVCHSSNGPGKTGWKTEKFNENVTGPTDYCYLDNIADDTTVKVYLMPTYTVQYQVVDENGKAADSAAYTVSADSAATLNPASVQPYAADFSNITACEVLKNTTEYSAEPGSLAPFHRWCSEENETQAIERVKTALMNYTVNTTVALPKLEAAQGYTVTGWTHGTQTLADSLDLSTLTGEELQALTDGNRSLTITFTAVVKKAEPEAPTPEPSQTPDPETPAPAPEQTAQPTAAPTAAPTEAPTATPTAAPVTTVTAVASAAPAPAATSAPTASPAPSAAPAGSIPQTGDAMPVAGLLVLALAALCGLAITVCRRSH